LEYYKKKILQAFKLSEKAQIISQSYYDGMNVMSGKINGVKLEIKTKFPHATFTHHIVHRINCVVVDMYYKIYKI